MKISDYIQNDILLPRLRQSGVLVVYEPDRCYREICLGLVGDKTRVIDASESSITARGEALVALQRMGQPDGRLERLLVYVPAKAPLSEDKKQRNPFAIFGTRVRLGAPVCGGKE